MREGPIPMRAHEVRAILAGRQSQFRRVIKPVQPRADGRWPAGRDPVPDCDYGQRGDRLWVRETWSLDPHPGANYRGGPRSPDGAEVMFRATDGWEGPWRPSIHMPRWASRITLEVTGVRVERLREISEEDAKAEGITEAEAAEFSDEGSPDPVAAFAHLWRAINGPESWDASPWCWVISFRRVQP